MKTFKKTALTIAIGALAVISTSANAAKYNKHHSKHFENVDYAKVVDVYPVTKQIKVSEPVRHCYDKKVWHDTSRKRQGNGYTNEIVGGLIGAAVGNRVGKKIGGSNGRDVATIAGAVLGGVIANDQERKHYRKHSHSTGYYKTVKHCDTSHNVHFEEKVVAYKVTYKYRGQIYKTRTKFHPGDRLKVRVNVSPYGHS